MRERLSDYQEEYGDLYNLEATPAESTHTAWQNMMWSSSRISLQQQRTVEHHITQTALICRLAIRRMYLPHWIFRMSCRRCIHQERYSIHSWEKNFRTGSQRQLWSEKSQRIISCRIIQCLQHILSVRIMDTFPESSILVRFVEKKQRYTAEQAFCWPRCKTWGDPFSPCLGRFGKAGFLSGCYDREEDTHSVAKGSKIWYDTKANKKTEREKEKLEEFNKTSGTVDGPPQGERRTSMKNRDKNGFASWRY